MGVQISELIKSKEIELELLSGKRLAIDAFNWIYQFLSIIRQKDGEPLRDSSGRVTSHLSGLFYRTINLLEAGIKPIYVFDGEPPELKRKTSDQRRDIREEAKEEWKRALERGDYEEARKYAQRATTITDEIIEDSKELLCAMGIPVIQAPSEGESQCTYLVINGDAWAIASQDYDALLFGCPRLVRNLSISGKRRRGDSYIIVKPELIELKNVLDELGINQTQLIILGMLVGTDYNPGGVKGYGPKKALELVKQRKTLDKIIEEINFNGESEAIFNLFKHPNITKKYNIEFKQFDENKVKKILCDEHDFSEERVENALKRISEVGKEKSLDVFFRKK